MNKKYSLKQMREVWIDAYLNGEVDWLAYLEAPSFFVRKGAEQISKAGQMANIERSQAKFPNRRPGDVEFKELISEIREHTEWATVSGFASFRRKGEIVSQCEFFELWLVLENRWQIASLCIEDINRAARP
ncbi:hypothetical protein [Trinickia mobilis]|uniref:hypothetical protein n=1 Tax=Trinickia mobilis TaxID=2816356 RepID=UPI001A90790B|nr:hypothetical protein [Trinickia mobilis]